MLRYKKFVTHHKLEVEALVERFFHPLLFKYLQITKEQVTPDLIKLKPILGEDFATEFVNKHSFVCQNEKGNIVGAALTSYLNQDEFMYQARHKCESFLKLPIKHNMAAKELAISKLSLYKNVELFEKKRQW